MGVRSLQLDSLPVERAVPGDLRQRLVVAVILIRLHRQDRCHPVDDVVRFLDAFLGDGGVRFLIFGHVFDRADHFADLAENSYQVEWFY